MDNQNMDNLVFAQRDRDIVAMTIGMINRVLGDGVASIDNIETKLNEAFSVCSSVGRKAGVFEGVQVVLNAFDEDAKSIRKEIPDA